MNKLYNQNIKTEEAVGKAKTVLVSIEGPAIVTTIIVRTIKYNESARLVFTGLVKVEEKIKKHLNNTILPIIDEILNQLKLPMQSYDISVANIGAISSSDSEFTIEGYSADVPIFLAILSESLHLPIKQNILFTGHISSKEGDIGQVKGLTEKSEAALREQGISEFVFPSLTEDNSIKVLKPKEYKRTVSAIRSCRGRINLTEVTNIEELIKKTLSDESIVLSSFYCEYYYKIKTDLVDETHSIIQYLLKNNDKRFWKSLESNFINKQVEKVHKLLNQHFSYHNKKNKYPQNYGVDLRNLIFSLPHSSKKSEGLFPLLTKSQYIKLIQYAKETDYEDISYLHDVVFGKLSSNESKKETREEGKPGRCIYKEIIDYILEKLDPNYIDTMILKPIDEARATYIFDKISVGSYEEFIESITSYYTHILRKTSLQSLKISKEKYSIETLSLLKQVFPTETKYNASISNCINGYNGGLRVVFDRLTDFLKTDTRNKYVDSIINEEINPLEHDTKKYIVEEIINREKNNLGLNEKDLIPEKYVDSYIEIIKAYANSKHMLNPIFERL